jgi:hypothetical protein
LPIPEPGVIPVSVSCIVVVILLTFLAASKELMETGNMLAQEIFEPVWIFQIINIAT